MNIFVLDLDQTLCAKYTCDKHIVKMPLETAQMLSTVIKSINPNDEATYRPSHKNHPCTLWVGTSQENFEWTIKLGMELCREYTERYGKIHASQKVIEYANKYKSKLPQIGMTTFAQAMPEKYKDPDTVIAYRNYYIGEKASIATWKNNKPNWW